MAKAIIHWIIASCLFVCAPALRAHQWQAEVDHFHRGDIEAAFATLEPLAQSGDLRLDPASVPAHAENLAFGFAMALGGWPGSLEAAPEDAPMSYHQAIRTIETLAVLLDASADAFDGATVEAFIRQGDALTAESSAAEYFRVTYGMRVLKVSGSDRAAAREYAHRFDILRAKVLR